MEKECLFIKKDPDRKDKIYIKYDNPNIDINFQLLPSRRLSRGSSKTSESNKDDENDNIIDYLVQGYLDYQKIINLERGRGAKSNKRKIKGRLHDRATQEERLIAESTDQAQNENEEISEEEMHKAPKVRASLEEDNKVVPDQFKQRMINRTFSSSIAKQNIMLSSAYDVPPIENLSLFINFLSSDGFDVEFSERNLFVSVFMLSLIMGTLYQEIIALLVDGKSNIYSINLEKKLLNVKLDNKLFGSEIEGFSLKNGKNISFKLPAGIVQIYRYIKKQISALPQDAQKNLYEKEKQYKLFMEEKKDSSPICVNFDFKNMWKILVTYSKNLYENNIASLFCIGKYSTLDRSALSYASTHKSGQIYSNFINDIYHELCMPKCINNLIGSNEVGLNDEYLFDKKMEYVGSNRLIKSEEIKKFFSLMRQAMLREDDQIKYFNLYAIYARYALGLLLATRYGRVSCNLEEISFELNLIRIVEKSDDRQNGIRFIPLCKQAKIIIRKYKSLCDKLGFLDNYIYYMDKEKKQILYGENKNILVNIFNQGYGLDENILDFIRKVPLNFGRHIAMKVAAENNFNMYYVQTMMGHYTKGTEQFGVVSTTNSQDYILKTSEFLGKIGRIYGI